MNDIDSLHSDLGNLLHRHGRITGREFQRAALTVAEGYFEASDLDCYFTAGDFGKALAEELERLGPPGGVKNIIKPRVYLTAPSEMFSYRQNFAFHNKG